MQIQKKTNHDNKFENAEINCADSDEEGNFRAELLGLGQLGLFGKESDACGRIHQLLSNQGRIGRRLFQRLMCSLMRSCGDLLRRKNHKILKLEKSLDYFHRKFVKVKHKLNMLSKNLFKIKNFDRPSSSDKNKPKLDRPFYSKKNSATLVRGSSASQDILNLIIGAKKLSIPQRHAPRDEHSSGCVNGTVDQSLLEPLAEERMKSFETEKNDFCRTESLQPKKRNPSPAKRDRAYKAAKGAQMRAGVKKERSTKKRAEQVGDAHKRPAPKKASEASEGSLTEEQSKFAETNKKIFKFKKKKPKMAVSQSKKILKSKKKNVSESLAKANWAARQKRTRRAPDEDALRRAKKADAEQRLTKSKNLSRKQCSSVKTTSNKYKQRKGHQRKHTDQGFLKASQTKPKNIKYSSSEQILESVRHPRNELHFVSQKTPGTGLEKLKIPKYLNVLSRMKSNVKEKGAGSKGKKMLRDLHLNSNCFRLKKKDKLANMQNLFANKNSSSLKHFPNGFNNLHLNYIFSNKKHKEHEGKYALNSLFPKKTPKSKTNIVLFKKKSVKD